MARQRVGLVPAACIVLVGAGALWVRAQGQEILGGSAPATPPAHFDLQALEHRFRQQPWYVQGVDAKGSLRLVIRPARYGAAGLRVELQVWNLAVEAKRVFPVDPIDYQLQFQDASGKRLDLYSLPPGDRPARQEADLPLLEPANYLGSTYIMSDFYTRVGKAAGVQARVSIHLYYGLDKSFQNLAPFILASDWVGVPAAPSTRNGTGQ
jgi:hypothetical protein